MDRAEYHKHLLALHARPADTTHPEGQKFKVGDIVQIVNPQSWFAKRKAGRIFRVEYSYFQKYGGADNDKRQYCLCSLDTGNTTSWYDEEELALYQEEWSDVIVEDVLDADIIIPVV